MRPSSGPLAGAVRPSNTEPLLRLNVEASDDAELAAVRDEALGLIREDTAR